VNAEAPWPTREDGSNKTVGEMTPDEMRAVMKAASERTKRHFERPEMQDGIRAFLLPGEA